MYEEFLSILDILNLARMRLQMYYSHTSVGTPAAKRYSTRIKELDEIIANYRLSSNKDQLFLPKIRNST